MSIKNNFELKIFLIRLASIIAAIILVMFFAKIWFVDSQRPTDKIKVISWQEAHKYYGQYVAVEGTIVATFNSGKACFLNFHPNYKRYFTAVIFASAFPSFPSDPENYYHGKKVRVTGFIKKYGEAPEIILNNPSQIEILE